MRATPAKWFPPIVIFSPRWITSTLSQVWRHSSARRKASASYRRRRSVVFREKTTPKPKVAPAALRSITSTSSLGSRRFIRRPNHSPAGPPPTIVIFLVVALFAFFAFFAFFARPGARSSSFRHARRRPRRLAPQDRVVVEGPRLVDRHRLRQRRDVDLAALRVGVEGVLPAGELDVLLRNAALAHQLRRLRDGERIADPPVGRAVDDDPLRSVLLHELAHPLAPHLRVGVDREGGPRAAVERRLHRLFVVVVDDQLRHRHLALGGELQAADDAALLVAVGRVDHHDEVVLRGEVELPGEGALLGRRDLVEADLADGDHPLLHREARHEREDLLRERLVVGLLGVQPDRAVVVHAELRGAEALPSDQAREVVEVAADLRPRLADPEGGLDDGADPRLRHRLVVVGGPRRHVDVGVEVVHSEVPILAPALVVARPRDAASSRCGRSIMASGSGGARFGWRFRAPRVHPGRWFRRTTPIRATSWRATPRRSGGSSAASSRTATPTTSSRS